MAYEQIMLNIDGGVATITLNRPEKLNAFTTQMMHELIDAFDVTDADDSVRAVIVTGAGRAFCAGADLDSGGDTFAEGGSDVVGDSGVPRDGGGMVALRIFRSLKPVIGLINGPAVGVGATMLLPMDFRLASDTARFGFVFTRRGIIPEATSSWFLPRLVGMSTALSWTYSGRVFPAAEALAGGLVTELCSPDRLIARGSELAHELTDNAAPVSVALTRQLMWRMLGAQHPMDAHRVDSRGILERGRSADAHEGVTSFLEKRDAVFTDRVSDGLPRIFPDWREPEFH